MAAKRDSRQRAAWLTFNYMARGTWLVIGLMSVAIVLAAIATVYRKSIKPVEQPITSPITSPTTMSATDAS